VNTEITKTSDMDWLQGWVFYDGDCPLCRDLASRFEKVLTRRGFDLAPLQASWVTDCLDLDVREPLTEMRLLTRHGLQLGGADAIIFLSRKIWWAWPLCVLARLPGVRRLLWTGYRRIAARRHCLDGSCSTRAPHRWFGGVLLIVLPLLAWALRTSLPAWGFMWAMAFAIYAGCKWLTWWEARGKLQGANFGRSAAYLLVWPGMDATAFLDETRRPARTKWRDWLPALLKCLLGAFLFWGVARWNSSKEHLLAGWMGLIGIIFILHFGIFHLLALFLQKAGLQVRPVMRNPIAATSLAEFWGERWNLAFHDLASNFLFRPLLPGLGVAGATLATFLISGLVHELVISLPAGGGFGLPTAYFLLQGVGMLFERSWLGARIGLRNGASGWLFTILFTAAPVFGLFHRPFVERIIVPFMQATGAL
jgi:alginate O-acetyltransferase complex protein AlgI